MDSLTVKNTAPMCPRDKTFGQDRDNPADRRLQQLVTRLLRQVVEAKFKPLGNLFG